MDKKYKNIIPVVLGCMMAGEMLAGIKVQAVENVLAAENRYTAGIADILDEGILETAPISVSGNGRKNNASENSVSGNSVSPNSALGNAVNAVSDANALNTAAEAAINEDGTLTQESEYSNLAIADVNDYVNVRSIPNTDGQIVGKMYDGSVAQILSVTGEGEEQWFQVVSGNVEGYIKSEFFIYGDEAAAVIDEYVIKYAVVKADRLNVRKEPDTGAGRIGYMNNGEKTELVEYGEQWTKILYGEGQEAYVASEYLTVEEQFIYAKSIEEEKKELEELKKQAKRQQESESETPENTTVQATPPPTDYSNVSELRTAIVDYAMQYEGNKYVSGGQSLEGGTDCSGFTSYVYAAFGYSISRTPQGQWANNGRQVSAEEIQPGDIVCYANGSRCSHVGIYIGNGQIIHSANTRKGVIVESMYYDNTFIGIKNVID